MLDRAVSTFWYRAMPLPSVDHAELRDQPARQEGAGVAAPARSLHHGACLRELSAGRTRRERASPGRRRPSCAARRPAPSRRRSASARYVASRLAWAGSGSAVVVSTMLMSGVRPSPPSSAAASSRPSEESIPSATWPAVGNSEAKVSTQPSQLAGGRLDGEEQEVAPGEARVAGRPDHEVVAPVDDERAGQPAHHQVGPVAERRHPHPTSSGSSPVLVRDRDRRSRAAPRRVMPSLVRTRALAVFSGTT